MDVNHNAADVACIFHLTVKKKSRECLHKDRFIVIEKKKHQH